ncbi:MAG: DNA polymerase III subunit delta [Campylobacterota bacterium]
MYRNEFDTQINQNRKYNAYMFYGQSTFLVEYYSSKIAKIHAPDGEIEKIYFDDYDFNSAKNMLMQSSLFSNTNTVLIKLNSKRPKKEVDELIKVCNTNSNSTVIFSCLGDGEFKTMANAFNPKSNCVSIRMFSPSNNEAIRILQEEAKLQNIDYEISALNHLYFMHKNDLSLCMNDLKKLSILNYKITSTVVNNHCFGIGDVSFEEFLNSLIEGNDISNDLNLLLEEGVNEIYLLNQITAYVQQLFMISSYARAISTPNPKEILGFNPPRKIWERKSKIAINIKPEVYLEMLQYLLNIELEFKTSKITNQNLYLQACLRKFTVLFR